MFRRKKEIKAQLNSVLIDSSWVDVKWSSNLYSKEKKRPNNTEVF